MKIVHKRVKKKEVKYGDIKVGQCYTIWGRIEMKTDYKFEDNGGVAGVDLATGQVYGGKGVLMVEPVTVEAHIIKEEE